jgi:hypothetical protein
VCACRLPDWLIFAESAGYAAVYQETKGKQVRGEEGGGQGYSTCCLLSALPQGLACNKAGTGQHS